MRYSIRMFFRSTVVNISKPLEGILFGWDGPQLPPVFIIGMPRGGTTLVYQTLCHCFNLSYTPMLTNRIPFAPAFAAWWALRKQPDYKSDFKSYYGKNRRMSSPGESTIWNLFFEMDRRYDRLDDLPLWKVRELRRIVGRIERIGGGPFINKNLRNNHRIKVLSEIFPSLIVLVVLRNPREAAISLLNGRIKNLGDPESWFSIKPSNYKELCKETPEKAVVGQVKGIIDDLISDSALIPKERLGVIHYEDFCRTPMAVMKNFQTFTGNLGLDLIMGRKPPDKFTVSCSKPDCLSADQIMAINENVEKRIPSSIFGNFLGTMLTTHNEI